MVNRYDILFQEPAIHKGDLFVEQEALAMRLYRSGLLRLDGGNDHINYVRFSIPQENIFHIFSHKELKDADLIVKTKAKINSLLSARRVDDDADYHLARLQGLMKKNTPMPEAQEKKTCRLIVQSSHPAVIMLMIAEHVPLFVSFDYQVGDMLDVESWKSAGTSSGLQSIGMTGYSVYVSCGGHPFLPKEYHTHAGDGANAAARMMVIAGQEIGHYADILRDERGMPVARHSANLSVTQATTNVRMGRWRDLEHMEELRHFLEEEGLEAQHKIDRHAVFLTKHRRTSLQAWFARRKSAVKGRLWLQHIQKFDGLSFVATLPKQHQNGLGMVTMLDDMAFNLAPQAGAYQRDNPVHEEAILCAEALARVPQQVNKWGHEAVKSLWPNLYPIYYGQIIPTCITALERMTGQPYAFAYTPPRRSPIARLRHAWRDAKKAWRGGLYIAK